jgi:hypothetical protein
MLATKQILILFLIVIFSVLGVVGLSKVAVSAEEVKFDPLAKTCEQAPNSAICKEKAATEGENPLSGEDSVLMKIIDILSLATAVIAIIVIVVAGITMTLSAGDSTKIQASRNAVIYALVGLIVVASSRAIVIFVVNRA